LLAVWRDEMKALQKEDSTLRYAVTNMEREEAEERKEKY